MSHFAEVDPETGVVLRVLVVEQDYINTGKLGDPARWVQTSYNGTIRKNYAGIGFTYDRVNDRFIAPKPPDRLLKGFDEATAQWLIKTPEEVKADEEKTGVTGNGKA